MIDRCCGRLADREAEPSDEQRPAGAGLRVGKVGSAGPEVLGVADRAGEGAFAARGYDHRPSEAFAGSDLAVGGSSFTAAVVWVGDKERVLAVARGDRLACGPGEREHNAARSGVGTDLA